MNKKLKSFIWYFRFIKKNTELKAQNEYFLTEKIPSYKQTINKLERILEEKNRSLKEVRREVDHMRIELSLMDSPKSCRKVKCCDENEAKQYASLVGAETGYTYIAYACNVCSKNKRTGESWWHITHKFEIFRGMSYDRKK